MNLPSTRIVLAALLGFASGCVTVRAVKSPGVALQQYRTFSWYEPQNPRPREIALERSPAGQAVRSALARDLEAKGLTETTQNPDVLVSYHVKLKQMLNVTDWGYPSWWWGYYGPGGTTVSQYTEGTIFVDLIDPKTNQVVWRGTASSVVSHPENPNPEKVAKAVNKLMKKYPTQVASATAPPAL